MTLALAALLLAGSVACSGASDAVSDESATDPSGAGASETDVGCGGASAPKCADGKACKIARDCASGVCTLSACMPPAPNDGVENGDESDVDCGGASAPKCAPGQGCRAHGDCTSDACSYEHECVETKGCTAHAGGDTCGAGETGEADAKHESCCTRVTVDDRPDAQGGSFAIDKYLVTAGRMRAFVERYQGNLKQWASEHPKGWDDSLSWSLPENMDDVDILLGPWGKRGCNVTSEGGRTWWQGAIGDDPDERSDFSQEALDEKALNCVPWNMAAAVCAFEGGRLVSASEMTWVYENRGRAAGATSYPWQWTDSAPYDPHASDARLVHRYSYQTPHPPEKMRTVGGQYPLDHAFWIAPPGRRPLGANMHGVQDAAGNLMPWVRDRESAFVWTQSWEEHEKKLQTTTWESDDPSGLPGGYYAIGVRCSY